MKAKYLAVLVVAIILISSMPLVASGQGGYESWRSVNMTGVSDSYLVIGMDGVEDSRLLINSAIVVYNLTGLRVYPIKCDFGLLRPGDIRATPSAFTILNASNVSINATITVSGDWVGTGGNWTHSDTCLPGVDTAGLIAIVEDGNGHSSVIVKKNEPYNYLVANLAPGDDCNFALEIYAPTQFTDHSPKANTILVSVEGD